MHYIGLCHNSLWNHVKARSLVFQVPMQVNAKRSTLSALFVAVLLVGGCSKHHSIIASAVSREPQVAPEQAAQPRVEGPTPAVAPGPTAAVQPPPVNLDPKPTNVPATPQPEKSITISAVGDMMFGTNYPDNKTAPSGDVNLLEFTSDALKGADVTFGNLEGPLLDRGGKAKKCAVEAACYRFRQPIALANQLVLNGFDVVSVANNHVGDFGEVGRVSTEKTLNDVGVAYAGLATKPFTIIVRKGLKIGICAFAPNAGTANLNNLKAVLKIVRGLSKKTDIVIVSLHAGGEGVAYRRVKSGVDKYLGENRGDIKKVAHAVIDNGADLVIGHGPHVVRGMELYQNRIIAYSLGNFYTYSKVSIAGYNGISPVLSVTLSENGAFQYGDILALQQTPMGGLEADPKKRAIREVALLSKLDFPKSDLIVDFDGFLHSRSTNPSINGTVTFP